MIGRTRHGLAARVSPGELQFATLVAKRLRFRAHDRIYLGRYEPSSPRRVYCTPDLIFDRGQLAVFYDGCYWHECPDHYPNARGGTSRQLDERNNRLLAEGGWNVFRVWEHESPRLAAARVVETVRRLRRVAPLLAEAAVSP